MSKQKHKFYRTVLKIVNTTYNDNVPVKLVLWGVVEKKTRQSVHVKHIGLTVYCGSVKHSGIDAYHYSRKVRILKYNEFESVINELKSKAFTHSFFSYVGGKTYTGTVRWATDYTGSLNTPFGDMFFYSCNIRSNNKELKAGQQVTFDMSNDPLITLGCGAINIKAI